MTARGYSQLAAVIFAIVALVQLARAAAGWTVTLNGTAMPIWPSGVAFVAAAALSWLGFRASRA
jgi:hypothetical protein